MESINSDERRTWREFCSVVQAPMQQFLDIQTTLLSEQITQLAGGTWTSVFPSKRPFRSVEEFRRIAPVHQWRDYLSILQPETYNTGRSDVHCWIQTSWSHGSWKHVPWTQRFFNTQSRHVIASLILSVARADGEVRPSKNFRVLPFLPSTPFASAWLGREVADRGVVASYLDSEQNSDHSSMPRRIQAGLRRSLRGGVDCVAGMASTLLMARNEFQRMSAHSSFRSFAVRNGLPSAMKRELLKLARHQNGRSLEPKDLLSPKSIITWGADTTILTPTLEAQWGAPVFQFYASSEAGIMAMQDWRRKNLIFLPTSVFLEFLPEGAPPKSDSLLLLDQLKDGQLYEPVITSFYGMPFLRLRQGDLLRVVGHNERGIPEFTFHARADDVIDLGSIARIDRPTLAEVLELVGVKEGAWHAGKEYVDGHPVLCLYVDADQEREAELQKQVHHVLGKVDPHYREARFTLGYPLLRVTAQRHAIASNGSALAGAQKVSS